MVPRMMIWESFRGFFGEDFTMMVVLLWNYFLPSALLFVCSCFGELLSDCSFGNFVLKPNLVTFFPARDVLYLCWG